MSAKFKAFSFPVIKSYSIVPVFRSSVIPRFPVSLSTHRYREGREGFRTERMSLRPYTVVSVQVLSPEGKICHSFFRANIVCA